MFGPCKAVVEGDTEVFNFLNIWYNGIIEKQRNLAFSGSVRGVGRVDEQVRVGAGLPGDLASTPHWKAPQPSINRLSSYQSRWF